MLDEDATTARLLVTCPDQPGIVSAVSTFLYHHGANITDLDQHSETSAGTFFLRLEFQTPKLDCSLEALEHNFRTRVAAEYDMEWQLTLARARKRMAILVSRHDHALMELLWRVQRQDLPAEIPLVISNHDDLRHEVERFGIAWHHVPVTPENRDEAFAEMARLLEEAGVEVIVLARYMQILPPSFVSRFPQRIINIHHSFLPAFVGANPYQQAWERGVKLIGATSHYVTDELDQGPIIEQNVQRVSHRHSAAELKSLGQDVERSVLLRAVTWHLEDRVIVDGNKTVVFVK